MPEATIWAASSAVTFAVWLTGLYLTRRARRISQRYRDQTKPMIERHTPAGINRHDPGDGT